MRTHLSKLQSVFLVSAILPTASINLQLYDAPAYTTIEISAAGGVLINSGIAINGSVIDVYTCYNTTGTSSAMLKTIDAGCTGMSQLPSEPLVPIQEITS